MDPLLQQRNRRGIAHVALERVGPKMQRHRQCPLSYAFASHSSKERRALVERDHATSDSRRVIKAADKVPSASPHRPAQVEC